MNNITLLCDVGDAEEVIKDEKKPCISGLFELREHLFPHKI